MPEEDLEAIDGELSLRRVLKRVVATWPRRVALALLALIPAVVGLAGGFAPIPDEGWPEVEPGEVVDLGPYTIAVEEFFVTREVRNQNLSEGDGWLGVVVVLEGLSAEPAAFEGVLFLLPPEAGSASPFDHPTPRSILRVDDAYPVTFIHAGIRERLVLLYEIEDVLAVPQTLSFRLVEGESGYSVLQEQDVWRQYLRAGVVTLQRSPYPPSLLIPLEGG